MKKVAVGLADPPDPEPTPSKSRLHRHWIAEWTVNVLVLLFAFASVAQPFVVPSGSMEDNVLPGDHIIVDKLAYSPYGAFGKYLLPYTDVRRGDVIVFRYPLDIRQDYVKRVIGVPGDRIRIAAKQLYLNGKRINEPYVVHKSSSVDTYRDFFPSESNILLPERARRMLAEHVVNGELVVPAGDYFAMGDNRDNSADSRYWGFVPRENIVGKPWVIYWSFEAPSDRLADPNINLHHIVDIALNFFSKTRWKRTLQIVRPYPIE